MKDTDFKDVSEVLEKKANRIITHSTLLRVASSSSFLEANGMLSQNTDYDFSSVRTMDDVKELLNGAVELLYQEMYQEIPHPEIVDVLASFHDFSNLKSALAVSFGLRETPDYLLASLVPKVEFQAFTDLSNDLFESTLPSHLLNSGIEARAIYTESESWSLTETFLDRKMYWWMLALADVIDNDFILEYLKTAIDFYNIYILISQKAHRRDRSLLTPFLIAGGRTPTEQMILQYSRPTSAVFPVHYHKFFGDSLNKTISLWEKKGGNIESMEQLLQKLLFATTQNIQYISYGAEVVFAYLLARENEIQTIGRLLQAKEDNLTFKEIKTIVENPFLP